MTASSEAAAAAAAASQQLSASEAPSAAVDNTTAESKDEVEAEAEAAAHAKSREFFQGLLNKLLRVKLTDGRVLVGQFLCTDRDANVILGSCAEYVPSSSSVDDVTSVSKAVGGGSDVTKENEEEDLDACMKTSVEPRILGLAMVKGKHIVTMHYDDIAHTSSAPKNSPQNQRKTTADAETASVQMENLYL